MPPRYHRLLSASLAPLGLGALLLYIVATHPVWIAAPMEVDLDPGWRAAYHHAFAEGWQFGPELVFTYGPYGFLHAHVYHPATFATSVALNLALAVVATVCLWRWGRHLRVHSVWIAAAILLVADGAEVSGDSWYLTLIALPLFWVWGSDRRPGAIQDVGWLHALMVCLALIGWIKHSYMVAAVAVVATCALDSLRRDERPWFVVTWGIALAGFWVAASQKPANFLDYMVGALEIVGGYGAAMSSPGPAGEAAVLGSVGLALAVVVAWSLVGARGLWGLPPALCAVALIALMLKSSLVRQDVAHLDYLAGGGTGILALAGVAALAQWRRKRSLALAVGSVLVLHWVTCAFVQGQRDIASPYPLSIAARLADIPSRVARSLGSVLHPERNRERYEVSRREIRKAIPLPSLEGPVDLLPDYLTIVLAHGFEYRTRPGLQSYSAYTPALLERNRAFFAGPRAPRYLLFSIAPMDGRYPALSDGFSWPTLLTRYRISDTAGHYLVLERDERARQQERSPIEDREIVLDEEVSIPRVRAGEALWVEIEMERTAAGAVLSAVFRPPRIWLEVATIDGRKGRFRLIPEIARAGFMLSPFVANALDFQHLAKQTRGPLWRDRAVASIRIRVADEPGQESAYHPTARLRVSTLRWERPGRPLSP